MNQFERITQSPETLMEFIDSISFEPLPDCAKCPAKTFCRSLEGEVDCRKAFAMWLGADVSEEESH